MSDKGQPNDTSVGEEGSVRGPTLVGNEAGYFITHIHHKFLSIAQAEANAIAEAQAEGDQEFLQDYTEERQHLLQLTPAVIARLQIHLSHHFQTGINREVLFDCLMLALREDEYVPMPEALNKDASLDAIYECRDKLEFFFDPDPGRAFASSEKGLLTKAFKKAAKDETASESILHWATHIYRYLADNFDAAWNIQYNLSQVEPDHVDPANVIGLENDDRFVRGSGPRPSA